MRALRVEQIKRVLARLAVIIDRRLNHLLVEEMLVRRERIDQTLHGVGIIQHFLGGFRQSLHFFAKPVPFRRADVVELLHHEVKISAVQHARRIGVINPIIRDDFIGVTFFPANVRNQLCGHGGRSHGKGVGLGFAIHE